MIAVGVILGIFLQDSLLRQSMNYGVNCKAICSKGCATFQNRNTCDLSSGKCLEGCSSGWHGFDCRNTCSKNCLKDICNERDGQCILGCKNGTSGDFCENECAGVSCGSKCTNCSLLRYEITTIDGYYGATTMKDGECVDTRWGKKCELDCPVECLQYKCKRNDGACVFGCHDDYCGTQHCQPCTTTLTNPEDANPKDVLGNKNIVQYVPTVLVTTAVSLSLLVCTVVTFSVYFMCIRLKICRRYVVQETSDRTFSEDRDVSENVNKDTETQQVTTGFYWEINADEMNDEAGRPGKCINVNTKGTQSTKGHGRKISLPSDDCGTDAHYEIVDAPQAGSDHQTARPMLASPKRDEGSMVGAYYLTPDTC